MTQALEAAPQDEPPVKRRRGSSGNYTSYKAANRAKIGKYALENGNERAKKYFLQEFPKLSESTVRYFKKLYQQELEKQRKKAEPQPVIMIPAQSKGRPKLLLDLDEKLLRFLKALRIKGGVVNIDLFTIRDCWNVNEMQIAFTIGCGQVTPTGGNITVR